jgi:hypothetical protein
LPTKASTELNGQLQMFDANIRHLPKGKIFFAKVHYCLGTKLYDVGVRVGDIIKCEMLSNSTENPSVKFYLGNSTFETTHDAEFEGCLVVYEGNIDGTGFIDEKSKKIAMSQLTS